MALHGSPAEGYGSDDKLAEAILYVSARLAERGDRYRGSVKLNKVLWRAGLRVVPAHRPPCHRGRVPTAGRGAGARPPPANPRSARAQR